MLWQLKIEFCINMICDHNILEQVNSLNVLEVLIFLTDNLQVV
jgi:hypothetical protein